MSTMTDNIVQHAEFWAAPDPYSVTAQDLVNIVQGANCEFSATLTAARNAVKGWDTFKVAGTETAWCGIFATMVLRDMGLKVRWSLLEGKMKYPAGEVEHRTSSAISTIKAGDVAYIGEFNHHFIVKWVSDDRKLLETIEGNQPGQTIQSRFRWVKSTVPGKSILGFYSIRV